MSTRKHVMPPVISTRTEIRDGRTFTVKVFKPGPRALPVPKRKTSHGR